MKTKNKVIIGVSIVAVIGTIIGLVIYFKNRNSATGTNMLPITQPVSSDPNCVPYTDEMQKRDTQKARAKCAPKGIIPIVGPGLFIQCMQKEKSKFPPINNCY